MFNDRGKDERAFYGNLGDLSDPLDALILDRSSVPRVENYLRSSPFQISYNLRPRNTFANESVQMNFMRSMYRF